MNIEELKLTEEQKTKLQSYIDTQVKDAEDRAKSDSEYIRQLKGNGYAEALSKTQKIVLKNFGLSKDEIKEVENDFEKILELGLKKVASSKDATNQELQDKLKQFEAEVIKYKDEVIPSIKTEYENKYIQKEVDSRTMDSIADNKDLLIVTPSVFKKLLKSEIQELDVVLSVDNDKINIKKSDSAFLYDGTNKIDNLDSLIMYVAKRTGTLKQSNGGNGGTGNGGGAGTQQTQESQAVKDMRAKLGI